MIHVYSLLFETLNEIIDIILFSIFCLIPQFAKRGAKISTRQEERGVGKE